MTQNVSRRDFFKMSGGLAVGAGVSARGLAPATAEAAPINTSTNLALSGQSGWQVHRDEGQRTGRFHLPLQ